MRKNENNQYESPRQKTYLRTCAPIEDSDQSAHLQYDQNLHWTHFGMPWMQLIFHADNEDSDQIVLMRRLI